MNQFLDAHAFKTIRFVYNSAFLAENVAVCATKGFEKETEERLKARELMRMENSLIEGKKLNGSKMVAMLHYPPFNEKAEPTDFAKGLAGQGVDACVYGHLHGRSCLGGFEGAYEGTAYHLVSADHLRFVPKCIAKL